MALFTAMLASPFVTRSWCAVQDSARRGPVLEARFVLGPDQCPKALEVWLVATPDTIQGLEVFLTWDRPDFALFQTETPKSPDSKTAKANTRTKTGSAAKSPEKLTPRPVIQRGNDLLKQWEYVEARGESGVWAKVTAVAYLMSETRPRPICPGESGVLFSIPVTLPKTLTSFVDGDSAVVRLDSLLTRGSDPQGNTLENLTLRHAVTRVTPCRQAAKPPR